MSTNDDFRKEVVNLLSKASKVALNRDAYFKGDFVAGQAVFYPNELAPTYLQAIRVLRRKSNNSKKLLSDGALERKLDDFIRNLLYADDQEKVKREIGLYIKNLFDEVAKMQSTSFLFLVPLMGLGIENSFSINGVTILRLTEENLVAVEKDNLIKVTDEQCKTYTEFIDYYKKENETETVAVIVVQAFDRNKALELALEKTDMCLHILRLYWRPSRSKFVIRDEYRAHFLEALYGFNLTKGGYHSHSFTSRNQHVSEGTFITKSEIAQIKMGLQKIERISARQEDKRTELEKNLITAIFWFGNGVKEYQKSMQFVQFVMALEALLIPDGVPAKKQFIAKRFATIIFCDGSDSQKKEAFATMRDFYDLRNSILHSGEGYVYNDDLNQVMYWARCTIQFLLTQTNKHPTVNSLIEKEFPIDDKLYEGL